MRPNPQIVPSGHIQSILLVTSLVDGHRIDFRLEDIDPSAIGVWTYYRAYLSSNTPSFKGVRKKALPDHAHTVNGYACRGSAYTSIFQEKNFSWVETYNSYSNAIAVDTAFPYAWIGSSPSLQKAEFAAVRKLGQRVNKRHVNLGVVMAERHQTAQLIAATATRIYRAARALKKGDLGEVYGALGISSRVPRAREFKRIASTPPDKRLANHWLEYTFGWTPLLSDVRGAAESLASHVVGDLFHDRAQASGTSSYEKLFVFDNESKHFNFKDEVVVKYVVKYRLDSYARAALASTGMSDPLSIAWEVLPYSFVIDWFIPVGNYLETLYAFDGFSLTSGTRSETRRASLSKDFSYHKVVPGQYETWVSGESFFREWHFSRSILSTFPSQVLPSFRNPLDKDPLWTFLTSMALMRGLFKGQSTRPLTGHEIPG